MECKFAIKYGDKRSYLAKMYPRLTSSVQKPNKYRINSTTSGFCTDEVRRGYIFAK